MLHTHSFTYSRHSIMFFSQYFSFPCQYHSTNAPYSFIHLPPRCIIFFSQYFSFPCQYNSPNAPYSFIHLPPTQYNVFLPVLQLPLSVSFHQCSILIHSSTTTLYNIFLPVPQFPPISIIPPMPHTHSFTYSRHSIMFFSQYHSFHLSVSFHQYPILIHSPTPDTL